MASLSFPERLQGLYEDVSTLQMELDGDGDYSVVDLPPLRGRLQKIQADFRILRNEAAGLYLTKAESKQLSEIGNNVKDAVSRVDLVRSKTMDQYIGGRQTRRDSEKFELFEVASKMIGNTYLDNPGVLPRSAVDHVGFIGATMELEFQDDPKFKKPAESLSDQWFANASMYSMQSSGMRVRLG